MNGIFFKFVSGKKRGDDRVESGFRKVYLAALASLLLSVVVGMVDAFPSTALVDMDDESSPVHPSDDMKTWIASVHDFGELTGCLLAIYFSDKFGRIRSLVLTTLPYVTGCVLIAEAKSSTVIIVGRVLTGISNGLCMAIVPTYVIEISSTDTRGLLGASFEMFDVVGILLANILGWLVRWTQLSLATGVLPIVAFLLLCFMPESPRWLVAHGYDEEAVKSIRFLHNSHVDPDREVAAIQESLCEQSAHSFSKISDLKQRIFWKPALLALILILFKQVCGSCVFMYYTVWIFEMTGTPIDSFVCAIVVMAVQVLATLFSMLIMDRVDRKTLLIISAIAMAIGLASFGTFFFAKDHDMSYFNIPFMNYLPLISLIVYIAFYSIGFGPIPWILMGELAPLKARSAIAGLATCFNSLLAFATTKTFIDTQSLLGASGTFWMYGGTCLASVVFVWWCLPETRGKALEDILLLFTDNASRGPVVETLYGSCDSMGARHVNNDDNDRKLIN